MYISKNVFTHLSIISNAKMVHLEILYITGFLKNEIQIVKLQFNGMWIFENITTQILQREISIIYH